MEKITCPNCGTENLANARFCSRCGNELPKIEIKHPEVQVSRASQASENKRNMLIGTVLGIVLFGLILYGVKQFILHKPLLENIMLEAAAKEINKTCPVMVDEATRLDNVAALPGKSLQYNFTLVNSEKSEFNLEAAKQYVEPNIIENIKTNASLKIYRDNKVTLIYNYKDKNGEPVWQLSVTPDMYQ